jgi:CheY-like chemotaxis protein
MAIGSKKILIVEDEALLVEALHDQLVKEGYKVEIARNGIEGIKKVHSFKPNLILLDIVMPVMDGLTMLKKLNEETPRLSIPVIVLTNLSTKKSIASAFEGGSVNFLLKVDYTLRELSKKIKDILHYNLK